MSEDTEDDLMREWLARDEEDEPLTDEDGNDILFGDDDD